MTGEEIAWILRQLVLRQRYGEMVQVLRLDQEQQDAAGDLQQSVKPFQKDAKLKDFVESTRCPEHHAGTYRPRSAVPRPSEPTTSSWRPLELQTRDIRYPAY